MKNSRNMATTTFPQQWPPPPLFASYSSHLPCIVRFWFWEDILIVLWCGCNSNCDKGLPHSWIGNHALIISWHMIISLNVMKRHHAFSNVIILRVKSKMLGFLFKYVIFTLHADPPTTSSSSKSTWTCGAQKGTLTPFEIWPAQTERGDYLIQT